MDLLRFLLHLVLFFGGDNLFEQFSNNDHQDLKQQGLLIMIMSILMMIMSVWMMMILNDHFLVMRWRYYRKGKDK